MGIPAAFLDRAYSMVSPYIGFVPGVDGAQTKQILNSIKSSMSNSSDTSRNAPVNKRVKFDRSKYPRL